MDIPETLNMDYMDAQYRAWQEDPDSVSRDWQFFFKGFDMGGKAGAPAPAEDGGVCTEDQALRQSKVEALKYRYRDLGHLLACLDPLAACPTDHPLLNISAFNLTTEDLDTTFYTRRFSETRQAKLKDIIKVLKETYCRSVGAEYMHLQDPDERRWLQDRMEPTANKPDLDGDGRIRILKKLIQAHEFEQFLNKKYAAQTRFSLEGAESLIPMLDALLLRATDQGCVEVILGMAHRGRLNVLTNVLFKPYEEIYREFINSYNPDSLVGAGDVKYHNGYLTDITLANGKDLRMFMVNNPSHLESVDPVVEGAAHARQNMLKGGDPNQVFPVLIHGDAAFAGQGVVTETLNLSQLDGYSTGGTLHIIINNQIGYTTLPEDARSTRYSTDVAKMLMVPVFHVHGENPEAVVHVIRLACDYRLAFGKDVVIDMICYRRYGHNEGDEPYFTQPRMYARIKDRPPVSELYAGQLTADGVIDQEAVDAAADDARSCLEEAFQAAQDNPRDFPKPAYYEEWKDYHGDFSHAADDTGVDKDALLDLARKLNAAPEGFNIYAKLKRLLAKRLESMESGEGIDWANAEALAFGSILSEGQFIRLSGQDSGRGTFSQRHAVLTDTESDDTYAPLAHLGPDQGKFTVRNSSLSEVGVLGFEYGYSIVRPDGLTIWEAQFGDFANNAQSVIDLYIASGETKWRRLSGLVMLLPHGWEGLGPEHSSARLERFLQLCADDNMQVCNLTTPAQYFHLLRRQARAGFRKPLVVMAPKSLLRNPRAVSNLSDMTAGYFRPVLDDDADAKTVERVLFCSGKIYYELLQRREALNAGDVAIVRIEQFYPLPEAALKEIMEKYKRTRQWVWVQEEPENMGAWRFMRPFLEDWLGTPLKYIGRKASASPATGFANIYRQEQGAITDQAVGPAPAQPSAS